MSSTVQQSAETYGQMANMSSGSCGSSFLNSSNNTNSNTNSQQMRSSYREEPVDFIDDREDSSDAAVYNFPWDVKNKASQLLLQSAKATLDSSKSMEKAAQQQQQAPPVPQCPPPSTLAKAPTKAVQEEDDESQYCAPWDLKLQEEMFKKMSESKKTSEGSSGSPKATENEANSVVNRSQNDSLIANGQNNTSLTNTSLTKSNNHNNSELNSSMKSNKSTTDLNGTSKILFSF